MLPTSIKRRPISGVKNLKHSRNGFRNFHIQSESGNAPPVQPPIKPQELDPQNNQEGQLALDVYQTSNEIIVLAPIAGVKLVDINVSITEDVLTIKGTRTLEHKIPEHDYLTQECFWGSFSRSILLPASVDSSKISASFKDAVLKISIPRTERLKTKLIRIKTE